MVVSHKELVVPEVFPFCVEEDGGAKLFAEVVQCLKCEELSLLRGGADLGWLWES